MLESEIKCDTLIYEYQIFESIFFKKGISCKENKILFFIAEEPSGQAC